MGLGLKISINLATSGKRTASLRVRRDITLPRSKEQEIKTEKCQAWASLGTRRDKRQMVPKEMHVLKKDFFLILKKAISVHD